MRMLRFGIPFALVLAFSSSALAQVEISAAARRHFETGVALLQDPDGARYEEAYREFRSAYAASPSWKILGNVGICAMKLERDGEAINAFQKYLTEGKAEIPADERAQVERDLQTLKVGSSAVVLSGLAPGDTVIDRRVPLSGNAIVNSYDVPSSPFTLHLRAGRHSITVQRAGHADGTFQFDAASGGDVEHTFALVPSGAPAPAPVAPAPSNQPPTSDSGGGGSGRKIAAYSALGVGAVGTALGVVFALQYGSKSSDADDRYDECAASQACGPSDADAIRTLDDEASSAGTLSVVGFAVGAAGLGTGLVLLLTAPSEKTARREPHVTPFVGIGRVGLKGSF
jgi:hypothetical protein